MSGPGEVAILWSSAQGGALRLGNFDIGKHRLKREHIEDGLRQKVLPALKAGGSARIVGLTSRTGSFGYNLALSRRRADAVIAELRIQLGAQPRVASDTGAGESVAALVGVPDGTEHPSWRSVIIVYSSQPDPPPLPRLAPQPRPPTMVWRFVTKDVYEPTKQFLGSRGGGGEDATAFLGQFFQGVIQPDSRVKEGERIMVPDTFAVTQIEITDGAGKGLASSSEAQWTTLRFRWGPPRTTVEVWSAAAKIMPVAFPAKLREHVTQSRAMEIYERPGHYLLR